MPTVFNSENKESLTYGEALGPAMEIKDQEDADQYFEDYVAFIRKELVKNPESRTADEIAQINLGYYSGYYGVEVQETVKRLFLAPHPIFDQQSTEGK